jgi:RNA polymerase sigma factor for flagellar operon FliA
MISMQGVSSALIAKNESWVRKQAQALARHLPSNVEKADLIQVGLIAVAQASLGFQWSGDRDSPEATEAFLRYAKARVKGAMLDELRQMDHLGRGQRRKIKVLQIARERWRGCHGCEPNLAQLSALCGIAIDEIGRLEQADAHGRMASHGGEHDEDSSEQVVSTPRDEVEARVDTGIVMRRLEQFFAALPPRERQVIDAYLGVGLTPTQLAVSLNVTPSRVSQIFKAVVQRLAAHFSQEPRRATDRLPDRSAEAFARRMAQREIELATRADDGPWGRLLEEVLIKPVDSVAADAKPPAPGADGRVRVRSNTRWE